VSELHIQPTVSLDNARSGVSVNPGAYLDRQSDQEIFKCFKTNKAIQENILSFMNMSNIRINSDIELSKLAS